MKASGKNLKQESSDTYLINDSLAIYFKLLFLFTQIEIAYLYQQKYFIYIRRERGYKTATNLIFGIS
ncbi:MAG: hypothetical protein AAGM46_22420 [Cyanobacteria bacterium J06582_2]